MKREIIVTDDGSSSIFVHDLGETYHSVYGATQEALHVYIKNGFNRFEKEKLAVLEMGFGTGLNFILTFKEAFIKNVVLDYVGVEAYPLKPDEWQALNYHNLTDELPIKLNELHALNWDEYHQLNDSIKLMKVNSRFENFTPNQTFDIVYYDAFGYNFQPELWTKDLFEKMYNSLNNDGILVTYACKGIIKQNLRAVGFTVKRVPGPPGKREMIVAYKK